MCLESFEGEEAQKNMTIIEACGHMFCNECWRRHLQIQIQDEGQAVSDARILLLR